MTIAGRIRRTSSRDIGGRRPDLLRLGGHGLTTGRRRGLLDHEREVTGQELAGGVQGTSCAYELRDVELEDVVHYLPLRVGQSRRPFRRQRQIGGNRRAGFRRCRLGSAVVADRPCRRTTVTRKDRPAPPIPGRLPPRRAGCPDQAAGRRSRFRGHWHHRD